MPAPRIYAPRLLLQNMLVRGGVELIYAGDRMAPAFRHGQVITLEPKPADLRPGDCVVACPEGVPDLFRIDSKGESGIVISCDGDPVFSSSMPESKVLARVRAPSRRAPRLRRAANRILLDIREALGGRLEAADDAAHSVKVKYDVQAPFYLAAPGHDIEKPLRDWIVAEVPQGRRILVVGSGTGKECFALAREGYEVAGIDFSGPMVALARQEAARLNLPVSFQEADLRFFQARPGSLGAVVFTYEVYSFVPWEDSRVELLTTLASWLEPGGRIFLSARRLKGGYEALMLSLQWLGRRREGSEWGDSHSRWIAPDGALRRSFIHLFTKGRLRREARRAGLRSGRTEASHVLLYSEPSRSTSA
ncbi:MAG TPA: class I SAM-dependent methyltransferase [Candidatus Polarisedimenticolia bacterium]|nr:class I SAM-dependent methyltransferase [Candidatus Polarisedimenticolia bacterium]